MNEVIKKLIEVQRLIAEEQKKLLTANKAPVQIAREIQELDSLCSSIASIIDDHRDY